MTTMLVLMTNVIPLRDAFLLQLTVMIMMHVPLTLAASLMDVKTPQSLVLITVVVQTIHAIPLVDVFTLL
jgi:hypothetical protein